MKICTRLRAPIYSSWLNHLLAAVTLLFGVPTGQTAEPAHLLREFARSQIIIAASSQRCIMFDVYIADTPEQRRNGLMYVESMDSNEGMLFIYTQPAEISMWMKNTLISLDMLFFDTTLSIHHIYRNAVPHSEAIISSKGSVIGVIELNGGATQQFGILTGDRIILPSTGRPEFKLSHPSQ